MAFLAHPPCALFLLVLISFSWLMGAAAAAVFPIPDGLAWKHNKHSPMPVYTQIDPTVFNGAFSQHLQGTADLKRKELLAFLSGLASNVAPQSRQEKVVRSPREERASMFQHPSREKVPCKNFFWKTFSSC
ncbi:cortistatin [Sceloporus undulatus]|uniref:cortistatin n=1 Tax=Sceloporus undulatus TaxID=8520 RepID=UPI001C4D8A1C|nr:cortistatin [Sceloporus undulatus]